jgi:hypothetical protein
MINDLIEKATGLLMKDLDSLDAAVRDKAIAQILYPIMGNIGEQVGQKIAASESSEIDRLINTINNTKGKDA